jgi:hypothetical protein
MRRLRILFAPPAIAIDEEPLGVEPGDSPPVSVEGFELMPPWQARPARGRRRTLATVPALAGAAAVALSVSGGHDATPIRAVAVQPAAPARPALVVQASPAPAIDVSRARR